MTDTTALSDLLARYVDARVAELEQAVQGIVTSDNPEEALTIALGEYGPGVDEVFAEKLRPVEGDHAYVEELGRRLSRDEALYLLENWSGTLADEIKHQAPVGEQIDRRGTLAELEAAWKEQQEQHERDQRAQYGREWLASRGRTA